MIIRIEDIKDVCSTIFPAVDSSQFLSITETLQLQAKNGILTMSVTNKEYLVKVNVEVDKNEEFVATVNAELFLRLVSYTTSETVEITVDKNNLTFKGNGLYKLPLIYDGDVLLTFPEIVIDNVTSEFDIDVSILHDILKYNSKQINIGTLSKPVQKMYYVDENGCITFTSGACINNFNLDKPVKILLNNRLVKLFKLFKSGKVHFKLGYDAISEDIIQTKVSFDSKDICITAILSCDDSMINSVPVSAIRGRATKDYPSCVTLNTEMLSQLINRLVLFTVSSNKEFTAYCKVKFTQDQFVVYDLEGENKETLLYEGTPMIKEEYETVLDLNDIKNTLETCTEQYISIKFGDGQAILISRGNIINVIPELHTV